MRIVINDDEVEKAVISLPKHIPNNKILIDHFLRNVPDVTENCRAACSTVGRVAAAAVARAINAFRARAGGDGGDRGTRRSCSMSAPNTAPTRAPEPPAARRHPTPGNSTIFQ